ncbi:hypothetical protein [Pseudomonas umsongensis]|uniref:hypothetical protein n=1 Tax=Pseudomonas umsongensis TaxID=198618 RepID=UPI001981D74A|nr:hypothetical protein [Pseudomonas umsongensis]
MSTQPRIFFNHTRHKFAIRWFDAAFDVLAFEGEEHLSQPFTAGDHKVKAAHHEFKGPDGQARQMPPLPQLSEHPFQSLERTDFSG